MSTLSPSKRALTEWFIGIGVLISCIWLIKFFSESEMRRLDKEVDRLCAIDGRSVIYETVKLPASKFNSYGQPMIPQNGKDDIGFGYYIQGGDELLDGHGAAPRAKLTRLQWRVIRTSDRKIIAEHIRYNRSGGYWLEGFPGVGHGKNCPDRLPMDIRERIFIRE